MALMTFRSITPVFRFGGLEPGSEYRTHGRFHGADYDVLFERTHPGPGGFRRLTEGASPETKQRLASVHFHEVFGAADHFVVVDVAYDLSGMSRAEIRDFRKRGNTHESATLGRAVLDALRLHCTAGLLVDRSYDWGWPRQLAVSSSSRRLIPQFAFSHLGTPQSTLPTSAHPALGKTIGAMARRQYPRSSGALNHVLDLALEYHRVAFNLEHTTHAFLILMTAFEALFKEGQRGSVQKAAIRLAEIVASTPEERAQVVNDFEAALPDGLIKIRNGVAHGNPAITREMASNRYPVLYAYVTRALQEIVVMPKRIVGDPVGYHEWMFDGQSRDAKLAAVTP